MSSNRPSKRKRRASLSQRLFSRRLRRAQASKGYRPSLENLETRQLMAADWPAADVLLPREAGPLESPTSMMLASPTGQAPVGDYSLGFVSWESMGRQAPADLFAQDRENSLAAADTGAVYVSERDTDLGAGGLIEIFDRDGNRLAAIDDAVFDSAVISDVEVGLDGKVYVALDLTSDGAGGQGALAVFHPDGTAAGLIPLPPDPAGASPKFYPSGFDVAADGTFWVAQPNSGKVLQVNSSGQVIGGGAVQGNPLDAAATPAGVYWSYEGYVNARADGKAWFARTGLNESQLWGPQSQSPDARRQGNAPTDAEEAADGALFVSNFGNQTLQKFNAAGTSLGTVATQHKPLALALGQTQTPSPPAPEPGEIHGAVYNDRNENGRRDVGEPGLADWTVYLDSNDNDLRDANEPFRTTDAQGNYAFTDLPAGNYIVAQEVPAGWRQTDPGGGAAQLFHTHAAAADGHHHHGEKGEPSFGANAPQNVHPAILRSFTPADVSPEELTRSLSPSREIAYAPVLLADLQASESEPNDDRSQANPVPLGFDAGENASIDVRGHLEFTGADVDYYRVELNAGDVLGVSVTGAMVGFMGVSIQDAQGQEMMGSSQNLQLYPAASPLPRNGTALAATVADVTGVYYVGVAMGVGDYTLNLRLFRPPLEGQAAGASQKLFLDFDGGTVDAGIFGGSGVRTLSPLSTFLPGWGLSAGDQNAVIDAIVASVRENLEEDMRAHGRNPNFDIEILNSRDHGDVWGQENVSRIIVGGTIDQLGIPTIGIAQSIDIGNFETEETAVVLLDKLSAPASDPSSLNQYGLAQGKTKIDLIGVGVGNIIAHEAGHFFGDYHTYQFNETPNLQDQGGNLPNTIGVGSDKVFGSADDVDVDFVEDEFHPSEGFTGWEDTGNIIAFGLTTPGGTTPSPESDKHYIDLDAGEIYIAAHFGNHQEVVETLPELSIGNRTLPEGNSGHRAFNFPVTLSEPSHETITVTVNTVDGTATAASGDYTPLGNQTLTFAPGETQKTVSVAVRGDLDAEGDETFFVELSNPSGAIIADNRGEGVIADDDSGPRQIVSGPESVAAPAGQTLRVPVRYDVSNADNTLTGLGLRIHFDSSKVAFQELTDVLQTSFVAQQAPANDASDFDNDPATDKYVLAAWSDPFNGAWPNAPLPVNLLTANFAFAEGLDDGTTTAINFSASSQAAGYGFQSDPVTLVVGSAVNLDVDGNQAADALTDGVVILRYLFGFRGAQLTGGAVDAQGERTDPQEIVDYLDQARDSMLDVDANGAADALTDGVVILRYLFGFRGAQLTGGAVDAQGQRIDPDAIAEFLDRFLPTGGGANLSGLRALAAANAIGAQVVTPSPASQNAAAGAAVTIDVDYTTAPADPTLTGLGLRMHYDSSALTFDELTNLLGSNLVAQQPPQNDAQNFDNDAATDKYVLAAWSDPFNGNWPGSLPQRLYSANFTTAEDFSGETFVRFTASSTAAGHSLDAGSARIALAAPVPPEASISDAAPVTEGAAAEFEVRLSKPSTQPVTVQFETANGAAVAGEDYDAVSQTLTFQPGETVKTISVVTRDDAVEEDDENFFANLIGVTGAVLGDVQGEGVIHDNEPVSDLIDVKLVAVRTPSAEGSSSLPASLTQAALGETYYVEIWTQDIGSPAAGVSGGYVDVHYTTALADAVRLTNDDFDVLPDGRIDDAAGLIDDLGGASFEGLRGAAPQWARLGYIQVQATALGVAEFSLSAGKLEFARHGKGQVDWGRVDLSDTARVTHSGTPEVHVTLVRTPTAVGAGGEVANLPANAAWIHEWEPFWAEVWVETRDMNHVGVAAARMNLNYNTQYATASRIEYGPAFTQSRTGQIDDAQGVVAELGGRTALTNVGDNQYVLLARALLEPTSSDDAPADEAGRRIGPYDLGVAVSDVEVELVNHGAAPAQIAAAPQTELWAVPYDIDDNDRIDVGDFSFFAPAFGRMVGNQQPPFTWWADFDHSGRVDNGDFSFLAPNFGMTAAEGESLLLPPNFPQGSESPGALAATAAPEAESSPSLRVAVTLTEQPTAASAETLPASLEVVEEGDRFFAEVWVQDASPNPVGVSGGFVDLHYPAELASAGKIMHDPYSLLTDGATDEAADLVNDLGGASMEGGLGAAPAWTKLAAVELVAEREGELRIDLSPGKLPLARFGQGNVAWSDVVFEGRTLNVTPRSLSWINPENRFDVNGDGAVSLVDLVAVVQDLRENGIGRELGKRTAGPESGKHFPDVNGDQILSLTDLLDVVAHLRNRDNDGGEGELYDPTAGRLDLILDGIAEDVTHAAR